MPEIKLEAVAKVYPFENVKGLVFGRKEAQKRLEAQKQHPYITNEGILAVHDFSLTIQDGEFVVLLGPSGCGKSTVLRMIAGLESVSAGEVYFDGQAMRDIPAQKRNVAMIFQEYALYPQLTVYENLAFPLKNRRVPREEIDQLVREVAETLNMAALLNRYPKDLSGGERQRVAIGRALVRQPVCFLMDEPFSNIDASLRVKLRTELKTLHRQLGISFVFVTHDQTEALMLGERIVVMRGGVIEQAASPKTLYNHPRNLFVAESIGSPKMNLVPGVLLSENGGVYSVTVWGHDIVLSGKTCAQLQANGIGERQVTLGIRPVRVALAAGGIAATLDGLENVGAEVNLHVKAGDTDLTVVIPAEKARSDVLAAGQQIHIQLPSEHLHLFDSESGESLLLPAP